MKRYPKSTAALAALTLAAAALFAAAAVAPKGPVRWLPAAEDQDGGPGGLPAAGGRGTPPLGHR